MRLPLPWMPALLAKELIELAQLRRTYVLRVAYALALLAVLLAVMPTDLMHLSPGLHPTMGTGGALFGHFIRGSLAAIYLFLPLLVAPLVTDEEERGNLDVLMVSGIGAWEYIVEKLLSRLVGMGSLLVIGLPFSAFAYSLGGVDSGQLLAATVAVTSACVQVGCWSMWCSARSHTSMRAIGQAYGWGVPWLLVATPVMAGLLGIANAIVLKALGTRGTVVLWDSAYCTPFSLIDAAATRHFTVWQTIIGSYPMALSTMLALFLAVRAFRRRSTSLSPFMREQLRLHRPGMISEKRRRQRIIATGGDREAMPDDRPLAWRELRRVRLYPWIGRLQKAWLMVLIFTWELGYFLVETERHRRISPVVDSWNFIDPCSCLLMVFGVVAISVSASGLVAGERSRRSLDVLLVLPLPTTELIAQKMANCRRLAKLFFLLIGLMAMGEAWSEMSLGKYRIAFLHLPFVLCIAWIHLELAAWLSLAVSLHVHAQTRAVIASLGAIAIWCAMPFLALALAWKLGFIDQSPEAWTFAELASPANVYQTRITLGGDWTIEVLANAVLYLIVLVSIRAYCLRRGDALLGRVG
jgi:ABC-type transport system involved in multi-copper enzyme maturation permease subunit